MNSNLRSYNWYKRYKVLAADMMNFQEFLLDSPRGVDEGTFNGAVLDGLELAATGSSLAIAVEAGIAVGPSGNFLGVIAQDVVEVAAPSATVARGLVVIRPSLTDQDYITKPTSPFETVPLRTKQGYELAFIPGVASATPEYPAKGANDVILCGVKLAVGQTAIAATDLDFTVREHIGANANLGKNTFRFDPRLKPSRASYRTMTVQPGQSAGSDGKSFIYAGRGVPTKFPKNIAGDFNFADTVLNFQTGAITGGDATSPDFTPTIPSAGNSIVATIVLRADDTIQVLYGTEGTYAQCRNAIENQISTGAGSIQAAPGSYKIAYAIVTSRSGSISDLDVLDCRALGGGGGGGGGGVFLDLFGSDDGSGALDTRAPVSKQKALQFDVGAFNRALGVVKVPQSYSQGSQIKVRISGETAATGGAMALQITASLIRKGVDACGSTANQNSATANFSGQSPANALIETATELTSLTGEVNGIGVEAGDELELSIEEVAATTLDAELYLRKAAVEVTFQ